MPGSNSGNLFHDLPATLPEELLETLVRTPAIRLERIISTGQASPPDFWYDQDEHEWVMVLTGSARLLIEGEPAPRALGPGDYVLLPAHQRHRVEATDSQQATVWLAVFFRD